MRVILMSEYERGFAAGYQMAMDQASSINNESYLPPPHGLRSKIRTKQKRKQTGKALKLTQMTKPIWEKYKKGSGKKTYFDIRSQVRKSLAFKKATKNM